MWAGPERGKKRAQELAQLLPILFAIDSKLQTSSLSLFFPASRDPIHSHTFTLEKEGEKKKIEANKHYGK